MAMANSVVDGSILMEPVASSSQFPTSVDELISSGQQEAMPTSQPHRPRERLIPPTDQMKRMLVALEKYSFVWRNTKGKKGQTNSCEWRTIAEAATGNPEDGPKMKKWFENIKSQIRYRITQAIKKCIINPENLAAEKDERLKIMYEHQPFKYWDEAEYLTKLLIFENKDLRVDIDGIYTQPPEAPNEEESASQRNPARTIVPYSQLLSGTPGFQETIPCGALPPMPRRCVPETQADNEDVFGGTTSQESYRSDLYGPGQTKIGCSAAEIAETQMEVSAESSVLDMIKQEPEEPDYQHGVLSLLARQEEERLHQSIDPTIMGIKQEVSHSDYCPPTGKNPLQYLFDPKNPHQQRYPTPSGGDFGITQEELEGRIQGFKRFQVFLDEKVMKQSPEDQMKFLRLFQATAGYLSNMETLRSSGAHPIPDGELIHEIEKIIENFQF